MDEQPNLIGGADGRQIRLTRFYNLNEDRLQQLKEMVKREPQPEFMHKPIWIPDIVEINSSKVKSKYCWAAIINRGDDRGKVVGYIRLRPYGGKLYGQIFIDAAFRRRGIGRDMLQLLARATSGDNSQIVFLVDPLNIASQKMMLKAGLELSKEKETMKNVNYMVYNYK